MSTSRAARAGGGLDRARRRELHRAGSRGLDVRGELHGVAHHGAHRERRPPVTAAGAEGSVGAPSTMMRLQYVPRSESARGDRDGIRHRHLRIRRHLDARRLRRDPRSVRARRRAGIVIVRRAVGREPVVRLVDARHLWEGAGIRDDDRARVLLAGRRDLLLHGAAQDGDLRASGNRRKARLRAWRRRTSGDGDGNPWGDSRMTRVACYGVETSVKVHAPRSSLEPPRLRGWR